MVVWYDVAKQNATNKSMQANPVLKDLSGNGRDATCYNFAWSEMSGVGGFLPTNHAFTNPNNTTGIATVEGNKVHITHTPDIVCAAYNNGLCAPGETRPETSFKVTGLTGTGLVLKASALYGLPNEITQDGVYTYPEFTNTTQFNLYNDLNFDETSFDVACDITIEQLPQYPGALVSDGVDDYAMVGSLPILTKKGGYTVIVKRTHIDNNLNQYTLIAKNSTNYNTDGAFKFEHLTGGYNCSTDSFGISTRLDFSSNDIVYQQTRSYNGEKRLNAGSFEDSNFMVIFNDGGYQPKLHACTALYSLILFNRDLTPEEIAWVKTNLIEQ